MSLSAKFKKFSKPAATEEKEVVTTPAPTPKQAIPKQNEIIKKDDDFMVDEDVNIEEDDNEEEVVKPSPKKAASKKVVIQEDDEEEVVAPVKKATSKKVVVEEDHVDEDEEVVVKPTKKATSAPAKKSGGFGKKKEIEASSKELKPGDWMPYETFLQLFHEKLQEELGDGAPDTKATSSKVLKCVENLMLEVLKE